MKLTLLAALGFVFLFAIGQAPAPSKNGFRLVGVPPLEHGYSNFKSQVIDSQEKFDAFVKQIAAQQNWNHRDVFLKAIADAKIDFANESLLLVRQTEGSGSNRVSIAPPELKGDKLVCVIHREDAGGTADMAYYCFAVAVDKGKAKEAEIWVNTKGSAKATKPQEVLALPAK